ncbi:uncharacterized protein BKA78DRAFT_343031 [Phyllosticta capitalensis]|uniref:Uncharacterized protein n=1 Tax=Phyllosticta capitalensis TaxID=121624 RepID=A0ABR1YWH4_9PEZI
MELFRLLSRCLCAVSLCFYLPALAVGSPTLLNLSLVFSGSAAITGVCSVFSPVFFYFRMRRKESAYKQALKDLFQAGKTLCGEAEREKQRLSSSEPLFVLFLEKLARLGALEARCRQFEMAFANVAESERDEFAILQRDCTDKMFRVIDEIGGCLSRVSDEAGRRIDQLNSLATEGRLLEHRAFYLDLKRCLALHRKYFDSQINLLNRAEEYRRELIIIQGYIPAAEN